MWKVAGSLIGWKMQSQDIMPMQYLAVEMIQELIALAKDIKSSHLRGEEQGLSPEEIAFYDALAENDTAIEAMGSEKLRLHCP